MKTQTLLIVGAVGGVAIAGLVIGRKALQVGGQAVDLAKEGAWAVTPWNNDNVIYGGVNSVGGAITGDSSFSLGSWIYDVTHPEPTPAPSYTSGGGGQFNGHGATGGW